MLKENNWEGRAGESGAAPAPATVIANVSWFPLEQNAIQAGRSLVDKTYDGKEHWFGTDLFCSWSYTGCSTRSLEANSNHAGAVRGGVLFSGDAQYVTSSGNLNYVPLF